MKNFKFIYGILISLLLFLGSIFLYQNAETINKNLSLFLSKKELPLPLSSFLSDLLKGVNSIHFDIERKKVDKKELPILEIFLSNGSLRKIEKKREETINKKRPILITSKKDWVKATIISDNFKIRKKVKALIRLKGDWGDHLNDPKKLSFRIKVKGNGYIFGMKKFSIQHPKTRNYQYEALILDMMRKNGILAPRYYLVDVRINGYKIGIMALEEHFSKELVESQQKREAPIVAIDESDIWKQRDISYNQIDINLSKYNLSPDWTVNIFNDYSVKEFKGAPFVKGSIKTNNSIKAISLLRDYIDEKLPPKKVFDYKTMSMWWVIVNIWGAYHGIYYQNKRFYFNPILSKFEPIAFDNIPNPYYLNPKLDTSVNFFNFIKDDEFYENSLKNIKELQKELNDPKFIKEFNNLQNRWLKLLAMDNMSYPKVTVDVLRENLKKFKKYIIENRQKLKNRAYRFHYPNDEIPSIIYDYDKLNIPLASHIRAFSFISNNKLLLEIKNQTARPITIERIFYKKGEKVIQELLKKPFTINPFKKGEKIHISKKEFIKHPLYPNKLALQIDYTYKGKHFFKDAILQFRNYFFEFSDFFDFAKDKNISINFNKREIVFSKGDYLINKSYYLPDWRVILKKGVHIKFKKGALLRIKGDLYSLGSENMPVTIEIESDENFKNMGLWGGILVLRGDKSIIRHTIFKGRKAFLKNRQDFRSITGCISFYETKVDINNSKFLDMQCEDALNIVKSRFNIENILIKNTHADAFDSDFSKGEIRNSRFENTGNDAIDVSGTKISVENIFFKNIGDKAVSVGEESILYGKNLIIQNASSGIVSKDLSKAYIKNSSFENIKASALLAFIKKEEYGAAMIDCKKCTFKNVKYKANSQKGNKIFIDSKEVKHSDFGRLQLKEMGYAK